MICFFALPPSQAASLRAELGIYPAFTEETEAANMENIVTHESCRGEAGNGSRPPTCALSCYEIEPGKWIHRPWDGCKTPVRESRDPLIPTRADCSCAGTVCSRCWLCAAVHCQCQPATACWHCGRGGHCGCTACRGAFAGEVAECLACRGSGKIAQ